MIPLGANWDGIGVRFALASEHATEVELCLFDAAGDTRERERIRLEGPEGGVWHAYLPEARPGLLYGYRVHGPWAPADGHRFNARKLLVDPYARALSGPVAWSDAILGHDPRDPTGAQRSELDSAGAMPRCVVVDDAFTWGDDRPPRIPWSDTVLYECHVKGMTALHRALPERLRGTYLGLASEPVITHLKRLGVTALSLLPVHQHGIDPHLAKLGRQNYWGYQPLAWLAPELGYASAPGAAAVSEFKSMVKALHAAGLEVVVDVVFNHTCEGGSLGSTLSLRGIDHAIYYRLDPADRSRCIDWTGCGNTLNVPQPRTAQLVLDALRYWVLEMHVDGFRFDLAATLGREPEAFTSAATFLRIVAQDPVLSRVKLIAEPWDLGPDGFQLGAFPHGWSEWNARYRDALRRFWRGDGGQLPEIASRIAGSSDIFGPGGRKPYASINHVTCHDGFTLRDLVSYEHKHNEENGEGNRDGNDANWSRSWGHEGEGAQAHVVRLRERAQRNLISTLALSLGVPMLAHGDELGRTQRGNNNAYSHDSELTWVDWSQLEREAPWLEFVAHVLRVRRAHPAFRRARYFRGEPPAPGALKDVTWLHPEGREMKSEDWGDPAAHVLGMLIASEDGAPALLALLNGGARSRRFALPSLTVAATSTEQWVELVNTARDAGRPGVHAARSATFALHAHSLVLLQHEAGT